jgi:Zn-finger nucleic acid-binding protein
MKCPNDNNEMHQVQITANYGLPLFLNQCDICGGIWFDASGLYRAKQGEAEKIDLVDTYILTASTPVENKIHLCPIDGAQLSRFTDANFPRDIFVERCPSCNGFWLNRGEFTKFQHARQALLTQKEPTEEDKKLQAQIQSILADHQNGDTESVLTKLNAFLSQPVGASSSARYLDDDENQSNGANAVGSFLNIAGTLLRLFVLK